MACTLEMDRVGPSHLIRPPRQLGLTLVELLVAMALLSLIMGLLYGALHLASRSWDTLEAKVGTTDERRVVWGFLRGSLERMQREPQPVHGMEHQVLLAGRGDALEYIAAMPAGVGLRGEYLLRLDLTGHDGNRQLVLRYWLFHPDVIEGGRAIPRWTPLVDDKGVYRPVLAQQDVASFLYGERVLLDKITEARFAFGALTEGGVLQWQDTWEDPRAPPALVALTAHFENGAWPTLMVSILPAGGRVGGNPIWP